MRKGLESGLVMGILLVSSTGITRPRGAGGTEQRLRLKVRISDQASVPPASLAGAKATATYVFDAIGVDSQWVDCPPGREGPVACAEPPRPTHFFVMIVPRPTPAYAHRSDLFGLALLPHSGRGSHLYVFHDRVQALSAEHRDLNHGTLLGHVLAHEIGHLLLGSNSHSSGGLMAGGWFAKELRRLSKGDLLFTWPEPLRMRAELAARMAEEAAIAPGRGSDEGFLNGDGPFPRLP